MIHVYGIPNCDTVKKSLQFLQQSNAGFTFHNFKKEGVSTEQLSRWIKQAGLDSLINKKGTTWKGLEPEMQEQAQDPAGAIRLMQSYPSLIKRPVVEWADGSVTTGFSEALFDARLK
ncbi:MAG: Spx/MgsR family RNA polymerase-binding regulatory protein [Chitinophagaceae bacterium]|nr:Spx/MgsR family RNA polymerase-binding regulatory protein [Chitinophagaceae bacterium]